MNSSIRNTLMQGALIACMVPLLGGCLGDSGSSNDSAAAPVTDPETTPAVTAATVLVVDTAASPLEGATIYAIPVADVEALSAVELSRDSGNFGQYSAQALAVDEPLEDLINGNFTPSGGGVATYPSAITDADGKAVLAGLATGASDKFFIYVKPATEDTHLPGGSLSREPLTGAALGATTNEVTVSTKPSAAATFVGSSTCLGCHGAQAGMKQTAHKLGFMTPGVPSGLQDTTYFSPADPNYDSDYDMGAALEKYTTDGTTIYFYDFDSSRSFDKYKTLESDPRIADPAAVVYATVRVYKDVDGKYQAEFTNVINPADPNSPMTHEVVLTYGGGVYKQRPITKIDDTLFMVPLQFNARGDEASPDRVRRQWRDYHLDWWLTVDADNPANSTFKTKPATKVSVDVQCAGCHFTGYNVTEKADGYYQAQGVADINGELHPVLGVTQELNIGCETCHGPGSDHAGAGGEGVAIVTPQNLTPERETMICGQCHSRAQGNGTFVNDQPLDSNNRMMVAGTSRAAFLETNTSRHDSASKDMWNDGLHSKAHHQQYTDFIQSAKYRNGSKLVTCASCHDLHKPGTDRHQLSGASDDSLCQSCHERDSKQHQIEKAGFDMIRASCIQCHNPKTANSGAGINQTFDEAFRGLDGTTLYLHGDISSHVFDVPGKSAIPMPVGYTQPGGINRPFGRCSGPCHF